MKSAFIVHGTKGNPHGNWFKWLWEKLQDQWYIVIIPTFPTPENQNLETWKEKMEQYKKYIWEETIFIAHSIWPAFVTHLLKELPLSVAWCYFVSGFLWEIGNEEYDRLNQTFFESMPSAEILKTKSKKYCMFQGEDDPYVPLSSAKRLADMLSIEIEIIPHWWHLNSESWYTKFPQLLEKITN